MDYSDLLTYTPPAYSYISGNDFSKEIGTIYALYDYLLSDDWGSIPYKMAINFKKEMKLNNVSFIYSNVIQSNYKNVN